MQRLSSAQAARIARIDPRNARVIVAALARELGFPAAGERPRRYAWSADEVVAMAVARALDPHGANPQRWAAGACRVGDAHARGLCPAYLVTAGDDAFGIVFDSEGAEQAAVELVRTIAAAGIVVRTVAVSPIVEELCDVLDRRALA